MSRSAPIRSRRRDPARRRSGANSRSITSVHPNSIFSLGGTIPFLNVRPQLDNMTHTHVSTYELRGAHASSAVAEAFASYFYTGTTNINDFASLSAVFDQYRFLKIEAWLTPRTAAGVAVDAGLLTTVIDYDDAAALASIASANDAANALTARGDMGHYRCWVPHAAIAAYNGAFAGYGNVTSPWIDAAYGNVQHYSLKIGTTATSVIITYDLTVRIISQWRNQR